MYAGEKVFFARSFLPVIIVYCNYMYVKYNIHIMFIETNTEIL